MSPEGKAHKHACCLFENFRLYHRQTRMLHWHQSVQVRLPMYPQRGACMHACMYACRPSSRFSDGPQCIRLLKLYLQRLRARNSVSTIQLTIQAIIQGGRQIGRPQETRHVSLRCHRCNPGLKCTRIFGSMKQHFRIVRRAVSFQLGVPVD